MASPRVRHLYLVGELMGVNVTLGGTAKVYCIHNRQKRRVKELEFDSNKIKIHMCSCCENLFLERTDTPMFCEICQRSPVYEPGGPLPDPIGVIL